MEITYKIMLPVQVLFTCHYILQKTVKLVAINFTVFNLQK